MRAMRVMRVMRAMRVGRPALSLFFRVDFLPLVTHMVMVSTNTGVCESRGGAGYTETFCEDWAGLLMSMEGGGGGRWWRGEKKMRHFANTGALK